MTFARGRLALGTAQFGLQYGVANTGGRVSVDTAAAILSEAWSNGLDTLDTAIAYGESESRLGEIGVQGWRVVSKLPPVPSECRDLPAWVDAQVTSSLARLRIDQLHSLLLHAPEQLSGDRGAELYRALVEVKTNGMAQTIGISVYDPSELALIVSRFAVDVVQVPVNVFDRRFAESGWLRRLHADGTEVHARSIFLQGLLLMLPELRPRYFARWDSLWARWRAWLDESGVTPLDACLAFAASVPEVDRMVIGVDSVVQLREILSSADASVSPPSDFGIKDRDLLEPSRWVLA